MQNYPWTVIRRRLTRQIRVGAVRVGGGAPISVQSMTTTPTEDVEATCSQICRIAEAGADMVRVSCPTPASTRAFERIVARSPVPVIADIHFHYERGLEAIKAGASCLRINPGNIGDSSRVTRLVETARAYCCPVRIGVNAGSLERHLVEKYGGPTPEAMVESALGHVRLLEEREFADYKISVKASDIFLTIAAYEALSAATDAPLHLGVTEAGSIRIGSIKSAVALGSLLRSGIGDTVRVSLSSDPVDEVRAGFDILKSLNVRHRGVTIISCPSCARQGFDVIGVVGELEERLAHIREPVVLSVIGCVVNGPGEAARADIGFTGGGGDSGMLYVSGAMSGKLSNRELVDRLVERVEHRAAQIRAESACDVDSPA